MLRIFNILARIDVNPNGHWSLFSLRFPQWCLEDRRAAELRGARDEMSSAERHLRLFLSRILEGLGVPFAHHRSDRGFYR